MQRAKIVLRRAERYEVWAQNVKIGEYSRLDYAEKTAKLMAGQVRQLSNTVEKPVNANAVVNPEHYSGWSCIVRFFIPSATPRILKNGEKREAMLPITQHKIHVKCLRSGQSWNYTGFKRGGEIRYSDSRKATIVDSSKPRKSLSAKDLQEELRRLMGDAKMDEVLTGLYGDAITKSEYDEMLGMPK